MNNTIHLKGWLVDYAEGMSFKGRDTVAEILASEIHCVCNDYDHSGSYFGENFAKDSMYIPKVLMRMHFSNEEITLEQAEEKQILSSIGELDIYTEWYGYSEWTILGYNVENFTVGNHDIEDILKSNEGKYAHILVDIL